MGANCGKSGGHRQPEPGTPPSRDGQAASGPPCAPVAGRMSSAGGVLAEHHSSFVRMNPGKVHTVYEVGEHTIGEGTFGVVRIGTHRLTEVKRAIKAVAKGSQSSASSLMKEISIMKAMDHPNIIQLFETFADARYLYLAMELCTGGELFDRIIKEHTFTEAQAATVMKQILHAVYYIHGSGYVHRDLKPENFIFHDTGSIESNTLKLIDFGTAAECRQGRHLKTKIGTLTYMAPQVLMGRYDQKCDTWSIGVIMYILLSGTPPFAADSEEALQSSIRSGFRKFPEEPWTGISEDAKELIRSLLKMTPSQRCSAEQALQHAWVREGAPKASGACIKDWMGPRLLQHKVKNDLEQAALEVVASQLQGDQVRCLRLAFEALDADGDGRLTLQELYQGLKQSGMDISSSEVKEMLSVADANKTGALDYTEFLAATLDRKTLLTEESLWTAFNVFDLNGDGVLTRQEVARVLEGGHFGARLPARQVLDMIAQFDQDGDGQLDFDEFSSMVRGSLEAAPGAAAGEAARIARAGG